MNARLLVPLTLFLLVPGTAGASVVVSEIAWMGTADNANAEWIELAGASGTEVTGWTLTAVDGQPSIPLSGTIPGSGYLILERTSDDTLPEVMADLVYTGAMGNAGEVFELRDGTGTLIDRVDGGENWSLGGDNTEKYTAQRSGGRWVTAPPTPGRANAEVDLSPSSAEESGTESGAHTTKPILTTRTTSKETHTKEVNLPPSPTPALSVDAGTDRTIAAGVPLTLYATARKEGGADIDLNTIVWNFGDGETGDGARVTHTYAYPGEYVVQVKAKRTQFRNPLTAEDSFVVTVVPLMLEVTHADHDSIELVNRGEYEVDLSRFALAVGSAHFRIPPGTIIRAGARIRFAAATTKLHAEGPRSVGVFTPGNVRVGATTTASPTHELFSTSTDPLPPESTDALDVGGGVEAGTELPAEEKVSLEALPLAAVGGAASESTDASPGTPLVWWVAGLVALIGVTASVLVLARREQVEVIEGFVVEGDD